MVLPLPRVKTALSEETEMPVITLMAFPSDAISSPAAFLMRVPLTVQ